MEAHQFRFRRGFGGRREPPPGPGGRERRGGIGGNRRRRDSVSFDHLNPRLIKPAGSYSVFLTTSIRVL